MKHFCHARNCTREVPPEKFMCSLHWFMVPRPLQLAIWKHYRKGQEIDKQPSREYLVAAQAAQDAVAYKEGLSE